MPRASPACYLKCSRQIFGADRCPCGSPNSRLTEASVHRMQRLRRRLCLRGPCHLPCSQRHPPVRPGRPSRGACCTSCMSGYVSSSQRTLASFSPGEEERAEPLVDTLQLLPLWRRDWGLQSAPAMVAAGLVGSLPSMPAWEPHQDSKCWQCRTAGRECGGSTLKPILN